jgi:hypothetical protein
VLTLNNVTTGDAYTPALTLGPAWPCNQITFLVANAPVFVQLADKSHSGSESPWGDEILVPPSTGTYTNITGIRFRSAVAGVPAQIVAQLVLPEDPLPVGSNPYTQALLPNNTVGGVSDVNAIGGTATAGLALTGAYQDIPGMVATFTPAVASTLLVWAAVQFNISGGGQGDLIARVLVNGASPGSAISTLNLAGGQLMEVPVVAAPTALAAGTPVTVKIQAAQLDGAGIGTVVQGDGTCWFSGIYF